MEKIKKRSIVFILILSLMAGLIMACLPTKSALAADDEGPSIEKGSRLSEYTENGEFSYSFTDMSASDFIPTGVEGGDTFSTKIPKVQGVDGMMVIDMSTTPIDATNYYRDDDETLTALNTQSPTMVNLAMDFWFYATTKENEGSLGGVTFYIHFGNGFYAYDMHDKGPDGQAGTADDSSVIKNYQPRTWVHYRLLIARGTFSTIIGYDFTKFGLSGVSNVDNTFYIYNPKLVVFEHNVNPHQNNDAYFTVLETQEVNPSGIDIKDTQTGIINEQSNTMILDYSFAAVSQEDSSALPTPEKTQISLESSDTSVATIDNTGLVTMLKPGKTTITATYGSFEETCELTVLRGVDSITVSGSETGKVGETIQLTATVAPSEAEQTVSWRSSNSRTASVDNNGLVTLLKSGTVTITATSTDGSGTRGTISITVEDIVAESITLDKTTFSGNIGDTFKLIPTITPEGVTQELEFASSDNKIATVDDEGNVTLVAAGTATITVTVGDKSATCAVTVAAENTGNNNDNGDGTTNNTEEGNGLSTGAIIGIVAAAVVVIGGGAAAIVVVKKKKA